MKRFTRPMKAETLEHLDDLIYPAIGSPKLDGIRCLRDGGEILSSTLKPIPNRYIREVLGELLPDGADGEIIVGQGDDFQDISSGVMSHGGQPAFTYWMFDYVVDDLTVPYRDRLVDQDRWWRECLLGPGAARYQCFIKIVPTRWIPDRAALDQFLKDCLADGFHEGVILRSPASPYKCGRATLREGWCLKVKYREDSEALVLGFEEEQANTNVAKLNELGLTKRSSAKAGKVGKGTLGKFLVRDVKTLIEFEVGTGKDLTKQLRQEIWDHRDRYLGKTIKYSYQACGVKEKPRQPSFLGFRDPGDMTDF